MMLTEKDNGNASRVEQDQLADKQKNKITQASYQCHLYTKILYTKINELRNQAATWLIDSYRCLI